MVATEDTRSSLGRNVNDPTAKGKGPPDTAARSAPRRAVSRTEAVHEALRQAIIEQRLTPGRNSPRMRSATPSAPAAPSPARPWAASPWRGWWS
jgi:hypothetical protein